MKKFFRKSTAAELAQREIEEAQRELLLAQSAYEYYLRIAQRNADRINRLTAFLAA